MSLLCCGTVNLLGVNFRVVTYHGADLNSSERDGDTPEVGLSLETEYRMAMHRKLSLCYFIECLLECVNKGETR